jgi:transposase InsO family protein
LLNRQFQAQKKNQKWVTDITYIHTSQGIIYLSVILDLFDRSIITYEMSTTPNSKLVLNNLKSAYKKERVAGELLLHSDQGTQYTSTASKGYGLHPKSGTIK